MARFFVSIFRQIILVCLVASVIHYLIQHKNFTFSPKEIRRIAEKYNGQHPIQCLPKLAADLRKQYHPHVLADRELQWVSFSAGGHRGKILFLHASLTEFVALLGSPAKSSGHLGVHWQNFTCSVLTGSLQRWKDGALAVREEFGPGDRFSQYMFEVAFGETSEDTFMLCYGRGMIPASGPYLLADSILSSVDPISVFNLVSVYTQAMLREVALGIQETFDVYARKFGLK